MTPFSLYKALSLCETKKAPFQGNYILISCKYDAIYSDKRLIPDNRTVRRSLERNHSAILTEQPVAPSNLQKYSHSGSLHECHEDGPAELGFLFFSPEDILRNTDHPCIYSDDGQLVWQGSPGNYSALRPQLLEGKHVITFWSGVSSTGGFGFGSISILNTSYKKYPVGSLWALHN
ncbi:hypothetical protein ZTR_03147 [Talaromyces verruculosus]|nr:hypothetical protein ZTR_03147 [Talaromyces verruculosus]